jgi:DNA helicase-2/ATP-dependent DNA helicase PcrA
VQKRLTAEGWDFSPEKTKILMLTHKVLAAEQDYRNLADAFDRNDAFTKKEDDHIAFLVDVVEPACEAYRERHYGKMFEYLKMKTPAIRSPADKAEWTTSMSQLLELRLTGSVGNVVDLLANRSSRIRLPEPVLRREERRLQPAEQLTPEDAIRVERLNRFRAVPYAEVIALSKYLNGHTCFSTKHGVKGAEFENVLVVVGRGWNKYNFDSMLALLGGRVSADKQESYEESRNLFYVASSRPKKRLALLFTQKLSPASLTTLNRLFGANMVIAI